ncbi:MAG: insulinase family protein [Candidatus Rokubacteria bacterium]|nr:insulinase family protein [Candidatus Rokubacteria bacterium]
MLVRWLSIVALVVQGCSAGVPAVAPPRSSLPVPTRLVLDNGVRLIIQEHRASDVVALHLWVGAGGRDERADELGFSHFVEHMLFKGTTRRGPGFVDRDVEGVGGRTNAGTSLDYTFYYLLLPARHAASGIELLADVAFNSVFDPKEMERERQVIFEEVRLSEDNARRSLMRQLYGLVFDSHPYGRPVLGAEAAMKAASRETLRGYYSRHYVPENMAVVVAGAVDPEAVRATVLRAFGSVPPAGFRRAPIPAPPPVEKGRRKEVPRPEKQAWLGLGWPAPRVDHPDALAVDLLASILGGSRSSRLHQSLRERHRVVASIRASYAALQGGGLFAVAAQLQPGDQEQAERLILEEVRGIQTEGVSEAERQRALIAAESQHAFATEKAEGLAYAYGYAETVWRLEAELRYLENLRAVTREHIQEAARRYLDLARYARLAFVPRESARGGPGVAPGGSRE